MKLLKCIFFITLPLFFIGCSSDDDSSVSVSEKIEITNAKAVFIGDKLGYSNIYEFSSTVTNNTNKQVTLVVKYNLRRVDTKEVVAYAESRELTIESKNKKSDSVERKPKGTLYSNVNYELDKATYRIINN